MTSVTLYHNPRCSKSRAVLALLEENDISPELVYYMDNPPDVKQLKALMKKLGMQVRDVLRRNEPEYEELGLDDENLAEEIVLDLLARHPRLLQRPIVVADGRAIIGRPPEAVLPFIEDL
ncbi:MAG: arsenate reductase (glutaredoxin) [Gammaproteobacteria bacterium]|nr:arsenate reductase (glutaredoxin) [Pseudomonadales bacterium]MCP5345959.1 arsenate reductase (glutaredoxin) [Pseudomonadales bacterium]